MDIKKRNIMNIIRMLQMGQVNTKNSIAAALDIASVTVHNAINQLVEIGLCMESGKYVSSGGRNAVVYQIDGRFGSLIGLNACRDELITTVYDIALKKHYEAHAPWDFGNPMACVNEMTRQAKLAIDTVGGLNNLCGGVTIPGRAEENGLIINIPDQPNWRVIPLGKLLSESIGMPIYVDNDNNALALSVKWAGLSEGLNSFVYLTIDQGVGVGVTVNGALFYGSNNNGCEIGHTSVMLDGPACKCGNRGCLQTFASDEALVSRLKPYGFHSIQDAIDAGRNAPCREAFTQTTRYISVAVEHVLKIFDPDAVFLQNSWMPALPEQFLQLKDMVYTDCPWVRRDRFRILLSNDPTIQSAAPVCIGLEKLFSPIENNIIYSRLRE